jgi:low affinity Fe/Cu permease
MKPAKKKLSNPKIKQQALYVMIFSFVTVLIWISGSLFKSQRKTGISPDLLELATPLSPTINIDLIDNIEESVNYSDQALANFQIYKIIKSKDGRIQQVVPIESDQTEISEEEIKVIIQETNPLPTPQLLNQQPLQTAPPQSSTPVPAATPQQAGSPGFGDDGKYYLD